jgi:3D (Asp-Asp-Asp) domain-containing protein
MRRAIIIAIFVLLLAAAAAAVAPATAPGTVPATMTTTAPVPGGASVPMGEYRITGYSPCVICCGKSDGITADGTYAPGFQGRLASAPKDIPFGTKLWVAGVGVVQVHDRGSAIKGRRLELFFQKYNEALQWGVQTRQVWLWKENR